MGDHKLNPVALANQAPRQTQRIPEYHFNFDVVVMPKDHVVVIARDRYFEQDGKKFITGAAGEAIPLPDDAEVVFEGEPSEGHEDKFDIVTILANTYIDKAASVLMVNNQVRGVALGVAVLSRVPLDEFRRRAKATLDGKSTPDFIDHSHRYQEIVRKAYEPAGD